VIFALAHMSCAGAWGWGGVPAILAAAGHRVVAPDLPLHAGVTPMDHAQLLVEEIGGGAEPVVLAGHSYGGIVVLPVAETISGRVLAVVSIDGIVVDDGESAHDARADKRDARRAEALERGDGMWTAGEPDRDDPPWRSRLVPMPLSAMESPVVLSGAVDRLPRTYVFCSRGGMDEQAPRARERGWTVVEVDASHGFPSEQPRACAELLMAAADPAGRR
jgi:pimeloyl-ACP methyl ester carboxylesterase